MQALGEASPRAVVGMPSARQHRLIATMPYNTRMKAALSEGLPEKFLAKVRGVTEVARPYTLFTRVDCVEAKILPTGTVSGSRSIETRRKVSCTAGQTEGTFGSAAKIPRA